MRSSLLLLTVLSLPLGLVAQDNTAPQMKAKPIVVGMQNAKGQSIGEARLKPAHDGQGIEIKLNLHDLPLGEHGIHVHQNAKCDAPDFKSAGGHVNPGHKKHGLESPDGPHAGDMPNLKVNDKGTAKQTITARGITFGDGANSAFANGGTALVIHANADDMKTDPAGNSGDRIACGVITR